MFDRKNPNVPKNIAMSTHVGPKSAQLLGRKSRVRLVMMMTNRSNHMPMLMHIATNITTNRFRRSLGNHSSCGKKTLHANIVHAAHE